MNKPVAYICGGHFEQPTASTECYEAVWSTGRSCRKCPLESCYRNGWKAADVRVDNSHIVERNGEGK